MNARAILIWQLHVITSVCPSVCVPVKLRYCIKTAKRIVEIFALPNSPVMLVFSELNAVSKFRWSNNERCFKQIITTV